MASDMIYRIEGSTLSLQTIAAKLSSFSDLKTLEIFSSDTIVLDKDLRLPGVDLIIVAPTWKIESSVTIDLSGEDGVTGNSDGKNGLPGGNGQNGGHFLGKAKSIIQEGKLIIKVNGGKGGTGGDGSNGRDGKPGKDGDEELVLARDKSVLKDKRKLGFQDGKSEYIMQEMLTYNSRYHAEYTSGTPGEDGENGGMAGPGGVGGSAGKVKIIMKDENRLTIQVVAHNGINGQNGQPGKPGKGGKGRVYSGVYLDVTLFPSLQGHIESVNLGGVSSAVTLGQTVKNFVIQKSAQKITSKAALEATKQAIAPLVKGTVSTLSKETAQQFGKQVTKTIVEKVGLETLKNAGESFIKKAVASTVTGTTGGTLQKILKPELVRAMARAEFPGLVQAGSIAGKGAFSLSSALGTFGMSVAGQTGLSILYKKLRSGWYIPVREGEDGKDGKMMSELNGSAMNREKKVDLNVLLARYFLGRHFVPKL